MISFDLGPMTVTRTRELIRDGDDGFSLVVCTGGGFRVISDQGDEAAIVPGGGALIPHYEPGGTVTKGDSKEIALVIPRQSLARVVRNPDRAARLPPSPHAMGLLTDYFTRIAARADGMPLALARLAEGHILDLLALACDPSGDWARAEPNGGVRAARLRKVLGIIAEECTEPRLTAATVATRLGLSVRYIHLLLEETGQTFAEHVGEHRLQAARRMLQSPVHGQCRVIDIAIACGFSDLSYFNRTFRKRFGDTPQSFRPSATRPGGS